MNYYPINLNINKKKCVVIGGGHVATRKVIKLIECGAKVFVISLNFSKTIIDFSKKSKHLYLFKKKYEPCDLDKAFIVIAATNSKKTNIKINLDAKKRLILLNIADAPALCDFTVPASIMRGDLLITVSTGGKSPGLAKKIKSNLENEFGEEYADLINLIGTIRDKLLSDNAIAKLDDTALDKLLKKEILNIIKAQETDKLDSLLSEILGNSCSYNSLMN